MSPGSVGGLAVEPGTGNIVIGDNASASFYVYAPDPTYGGVFSTYANVGNSVTAVAVDPVSKAVYVSDAVNNTIRRLDSDGNSPATYTPDSFAPAAGAVTDFSGGLAVDPTTRDLLVVDPTAASVVRLSHTTGAELGRFNGSSAPGGAFSAPSSIAVAPDRSIYVVDDTRVLHFNSNGGYLGALPTTGSVQGVAVNAANGNVVIETGLLGPLSTGNGQLSGFTSAGTPLFRSSFPDSTARAAARGLAWDPVEDRIYAAINDGTSARTPSVQTFVSAPSPGVDTPTVSAVQRTSAHVATAVDPGAAQPGDTHLRFEYCKASDPCASYPSSDPSNVNNPWQRASDHVTNGGTVQDDLTSLAPNTAYRVRAVAYNSVASTTSSVTSFTTVQSAPEVVTGAAGEIGMSSADLQGTINPYGLPSTYHFEYGLGLDYGTSIPVPDATAFNGTVRRVFVRKATGLNPGSVYHYRLVATNAIGTTYGADQSFVTTSSGAVRAYEQVTPVDKRGSTLNEVFGFQAADDGNALEYALQGAPADTSAAPQFPRFMSTRGAGDWQSGTALDPPTAVTRMYVSSSTLAVSADFQHTLVASNRALAAGAVDGQANLYAVDVPSGTYRFVGTSNAPGAFGAMVGVGQANMFLAGANDFSWVVFVSASPLLPGVTGAALYKWTSTGGLRLLSTLPNGAIPSAGVILQSTSASATRWVSADGTQGYFALSGGSASGVYRWVDGQATRAISLSQASGGPVGVQPGELAFVSRDGRYAVFTAGKLTNAAPASPRSVYVYDASDGSLRYVGTTYAGVIENVVAASDDAQTVFLDTSAGLVAWRDGASHVIRSSRLAPASAFTSPSGRYLAFVDGPDRDTYPDVLDVYLYDADAQQLTCVTCTNGLAAGQQRAALPSAVRNISNRTPTAVTDAGLVYFDTNAGLVPGDRNGRRDVYTYDAGQLTLISPGTGNYDAHYADASASGNDVFFTTAEPLVGRDDDGAPDIYDLRVGGGLPAQNPVGPPAACVGSECREPSAGVMVSPFVMSPPAIGGASVRRTNLTKVRVSLAKVSFTAKALHITIRSSQRGRVKVTGSRVRTTVRNLSAAGTYRMVVPLSTKARSLRRAHRKFKVTAKVTLAGGWGTATAKISRTLGK